VNVLIRSGPELTYDNGGDDQRPNSGELQHAPSFLSQGVRCHAYNSGVVEVNASR